MGKWSKEELFDNLLQDFGIANADEIDLVAEINGYTEKTMLDILYVRTGFNNFQQAFEEYAVNSEPADWGATWDDLA